MPPVLKIILIILAALAALLIIAINLVLFVRVKIKVGFKDKKLSARLYVGGVCLLSLPRPPKKLRRLRTYTKKKAMRAAARQAKHVEDYLEDVRRHPIYRALMQKYAESKKKKPRAEGTAAPKQQKQESSLDIEVLMTLLAEIFEAALDGTHKGVQVQICRLHVKVVGPDAAATAMITGSLWAATANLLGVLDRLTRLRVRRADVAIIPDYTGEKTEAELSLAMSSNLFRALGIVLPLIPIILSHKNNLIKQPAKAASTQ